MPTYAQGRRIRYPRPGDWVRNEDSMWDPKADRGMVTAVGEDGRVRTEWEDGEWVFEPDVLYLHHSGWFWVAPAPEEVKGW